MHILKTFGSPKNPGVSESAIGLPECHNVAKGCPKDKEATKGCPVVARILQKGLKCLPNLI